MTRRRYLLSFVVCCNLLIVLSVIYRSYKVVGCSSVLLMTAPSCKATIRRAYVTLVCVFLSSLKTL
jgi:hypothetical protein